MKPLIITNETFEHVKTRLNSPVSIYKGNGRFLRIGPKNLILRELNFHRELLKFGFPVAEIVAEGKNGNRYFYIENSLGEKPKSAPFCEDCQKKGGISKTNFQKLLSLAEKFAKAQLKTIGPKEKTKHKNFYAGIYVSDAKKEVPAFKGGVDRAWKKLSEKTKAIPLVLTHGDLNPHNIFAKGVIDFGNSFVAPAGYDLISIIYHIDNFPETEGYELRRKYWFSEKQKELYFSRLDNIYRKASLPKLSGFINDFVFARSIWAAAHMQNFPKLQQWRFKRLKKILAAYLANKDKSSLQIS